MNFPFGKKREAEKTISMLKEQYGIDLPKMQEETKTFHSQFGNSLQEFKASFDNYIASKVNYTQYQFQDYTVARIVTELYLKDPVVSAAIGRYQMHYPEPFKKIYDGKKESTDKNLISLIRNPNPWMTESKLARYEITYQLWSGNSYTLIIKEDNGEPFQLFPFSGLNMYPVPSETEFISHYSFVTAEGIVSRIEPEDVIFKPWISIDPRRPFMGISPMQLCSRDIQTNIGLTDFMASYVNNLDVPGLILTRTGKDAENVIGMSEVPDTDAEDIKAQTKVRFGNDQRGSSGIVDAGWSAQYLGFPLKEVVVEGAYCVPQTNICSNFYISPEYLKVEAGLRSSTYDNQNTAKLDFFQGPLTSLWVQNCDEDTKALRPYFGEQIKIEEDLSSVAVLKDYRQKQLAQVMNSVTELQKAYFAGAIPSREAAIENAELMLAGVSGVEVANLFPVFTRPVQQDLSKIAISENGIAAN